jgi:phosphoglycolate phosphatase-like HAD superfamily hydrolase
LTNSSESRQPADNDYPVVLLFDIDGTLIDSAGAGGGALLKALETSFGIQQATPVALQGRTDLGIMSELLETHGIEPNEVNLRILCDTYFAFLPDEMHLRGGKLLPGVEALLRYLSGIDSCRIGLLSGNMPDSAQIKLNHFQLWDYFEFGIFGDRAPQRPHLAEPTLSFLAETVTPELPAANIVIIGDTPLDIDLARKMGVRCLAVSTGGYATQELLQAGAHRVDQDLSDLVRVSRWLLDPATLLSSLM